jgi:hypothetical protein
LIQEFILAPIFLSYFITSPCKFKKFNFDIESYFPDFQSFFFLEGEAGSC